MKYFSATKKNKTINPCNNMNGTQNDYAERIQTPPLKKKSHSILFHLYKHLKNVI